MFPQRHLASFVAARRLVRGPNIVKLGMEIRESVNLPLTPTYPYKSGQNQFAFYSKKQSQLKSNLIESKLIFHSDTDAAAAAAGAAAAASAAAFVFTTIFIVIATVAAAEAAAAPAAAASVSE